MLNQIDLYVECKDTSSLYSDIAIKIHGFIMKIIDTNYAEKLHKQELNPFSLFAFPIQDGFIIRVSTLNDEAFQIIEALKGMSEIRIYGISEPVLVKKVENYPPVSLEYLANYATKRKYKLLIAKV